MNRGGSARQAMQKNPITTQADAARPTGMPKSRKIVRIAYPITSMNPKVPAQAPKMMMFLIPAPYHARAAGAPAIMPNEVTPWLS